MTMKIMKDIRKDRRAKGLCAKCGKPSPDSYRCEYCALDHSFIISKAQRPTIKVQSKSKCPICGKQSTRRPSCFECEDQALRELNNKIRLRRLRYPPPKDRVGASVATAKITYDTTCIIHPNKPKPDGYVLVRLHGRRTYAHKVAWEKAHGPIPEGARICHSCGTKNCVNPDHLYMEGGI